jgi:putative membrane protein
MMDGAWGMTLGGWVWMVVWIGALLVMVWLLVAGGHRVERDDPLDILRARYARGEINDAEFRHARDLLDDPGGRK